MSGNDPEVAGLVLTYLLVFIFLGIFLLSPHIPPAFYVLGVGFIIIIGTIIINLVAGATDITVFVAVIGAFAWVASILIAAGIEIVVALRKLYAWANRYRRRRHDD